MLSGFKIDKMVLGGPAHNSGQLQHGDVILQVWDPPAAAATGWTKCYPALCFCLLLLLLLLFLLSPPPPRRRRRRRTHQQ